MQWEAKDGGYWIPKVDFTRLRKWREDVETWFKKYYIVTREPIRGWIKGGYSSKQVISLPPPRKLGGFLICSYNS